MAIQRAAGKAPAGRLVLLTSVLALAVASAAAFSRVFRGDRATLELSAAAGAAVLLAGLLERRHMLVATAVSATGLVVAVGLVVFPDTTRWGLPTEATLRAARAAWSAVGSVADTQPAPAEPLAPLMLAALIAAWAASFSAHALATRARSPFLAVLPPAALLAFTGIVLREGARPLYVAAFLTAVLGVLFADGLRRMAQWGPVAVWQGPRRLPLGTAMRGGRRIALACLAIALFLPGLLPGFRAAGLVDLRRGAGGPARVSVDPLVDIRPQLLREQPIPMFSVTADRPTYWRFQALDIFTGRLWLPSDAEADRGIVLSAGPLQGVPVSRLDPSVHTVLIHQAFRFDRYPQPWLPAAFEPAEVRSSSPLRYDPVTAALYLPDDDRVGFSYQVTSRVVVPTERQLDAVTSLGSGPAVEHYTALPGTTPPQIYSIAHRLTDGQPTPYRKILAIQDYLRNTFRYSLNVRPGHGIDDVLYFLTRSKAGYCEQFAGSMAVLLRALGIPARLAVGFTPGTYDPTRHRYQVTTSEAHTWVEVLFPTYGWVMFDPTPGRTNPLATDYDFPLPQVRETQDLSEACRLLSRGGDSAACATGLAPRPTPGASTPAGPRLEPTPAPAGEGATRRRPWAPVPPWALAGAAVLVAALIPGGKAVRRRIGLARARTPAQRILAAYEGLAARAADVGLGQRSSETLDEYRARLQEAVPALDGQLDRLTALVRLAAYSDRPITEDQAELALAAARAVGREVRRKTGPGRWAAGWFRVDWSVLRRWLAG